MCSTVQAFSFLFFFSLTLLCSLVLFPVQINPAKYKGIGSGFGVLYREQGFGGFFRGWLPTLIGYSFQGACKFGFYEYFKKLYSDIAGKLLFLLLILLLSLSLSLSLWTSPSLSLSLWTPQPLPVSLSLLPSLSRVLQEAPLQYRWYAALTAVHGTATVMLTAKASQCQCQCDSQSVCVTMRVSQCQCQCESHCRSHWDISGTPLSLLRLSPRQWLEAKVKQRVLSWAQGERNENRALSLVHGPEHEREKHRAELFPKHDADKLRNEMDPSYLAPEQERISLMSRTGWD